MKLMCKNCGLVKHYEEFYKHPSKKNGRMSWCKDCSKERIKNHASDKLHPHYLAQSKRDINEIAREYNQAHPIKPSFFTGLISEAQAGDSWAKIKDNFRLFVN